MGKVKAAHTRSRPHCKGLRDLNSRVCLNVEQATQCALLGMVRACWVSRRRTNPAIFFMNQVFLAQVFRTAVTPLITDTLVQAFGESLRQAIRKGFGHDGVVVVVLGAITVAEFLQPDTAGYCKCANVIAQPCFFWRDEIRKRPAWLASFFICPLAQEMKSFVNVAALVVFI